MYWTDTQRQCVCVCIRVVKRRTHTVFCPINWRQASFKFVACVSPQTFTTTTITSSPVQQAHTKHWGLYDTGHVSPEHQCALYYGKEGKGKKSNGQPAFFTLQGVFTGCAHTHTHFELTKENSNREKRNRQRAHLHVVPK